MKKIMYLALAASTLPMAAMAGGMAQPVIEAPVQMAAPIIVAPSVNWTGAYAGAELGYGNITAKGGRADASGGVAGLNLGYRKDFGSLVLGGEVGVTKNDLGVSGGDDQINSALSAQVSLGADLGQTLIYVAGGVARANASVGGDTSYDNGYFAGVGADYLLNDKWTIGGEIKSSVYNDFGSSGIDLKDTSIGMKVGMRF